MEAKTSGQAALYRTAIAEIRRQDRECFCQYTYLKTDTEDFKLDTENKNSFNASKEESIES